MKGRKGSCQPLMIESIRPECRCGKCLAVREIKVSCQPLFLVYVSLSVLNVDVESVLTVKGRKGSCQPLMFESIRFECKCVKNV